MERQYDWVKQRTEQESKAEVMLEKMEEMPVGPMPSYKEVVDWLRDISNQVTQSDPWNAGISGR